MKEDLKQILSDIFTSSQYSIIESNNYDLIASKNSYTIYIKIGTQAEYQKIRYFSNDLNENNQNEKSIGVYVVTDNPDNRVYHYAEKLGVILWGRDELAFQIGKAVIADIEKQPCDLELIQPQMSNQWNEAESTYQQNLYKPAFEQSNPYVGVDNYFNDQNNAQENVPSNCLNIKTAPLNTSKDNAISAAKPHLSQIQNAVLKFVPYWKFNYSISTEQSYNSKIIDISGEDTGYLNALNGNLEPLLIGKIVENIEEPNDNYIVVSKSLTKEEAGNKILKMIIEKNTRNIRFDKTMGEAMISEHKKFKPKAKDIDYHLELVYLPVWEVKDNRNSIEINGYNSEIFNEPTGNDVEFI
ncbi:hypothetical protein [Methanohalobium sp.]|uniref:hypothetical protein n=1 Tax=Methanohalobium sp. TaxID=2837493 RepID=UPI00397C3385